MKLTFTLACVIGVLTGCAHAPPSAQVIPSAATYAPPKEVGALLPSAPEYERIASSKDFIRDPRLDEAALLVFDAYSESRAHLPARYLKQVLWRLGVVGEFAGQAGSWVSAGNRTARLDAHLVTFLSERNAEHRLYGFSRGRVDVPGSQVILMAKHLVDLEPVPRFPAPNQTVTVKGVIRHRDESSLTVYYPGDPTPHAVPVSGGRRFELSWNAPSQPGEHWLQLLAPAPAGTSVDEGKTLLRLRFVVGEETFDVSEPPRNAADLRARVIAQLNQRRVQSGLQLLKSSAQADAIAAEHAAQVTNDAAAAPKYSEAGFMPSATLVLSDKGSSALGDLIDQLDAPSKHVRFLDKAIDTVAVSTLQRGDEWTLVVSGLRATGSDSGGR